MGIVYQAVGGGTAAINVALSFPSAVTAGRSIIVFASQEGVNPQRNFTVSDAAGNTFVPVLDASGSNGSRIGMWVCVTALATTTITIAADATPVRFSAGILEIDPLNTLYYHWIERQVNETSAASTGHQCAPDPGIIIQPNDVINVIVGQADGSSSIGTVSLPPAYSGVSVSLLSSTMAGYRTGNTGSGERAVWSHTGANRQCNNVLHSFIFASTTAPANTIQPQLIPMVTAAPNPTIFVQNRVLQVSSGNGAITNNVLAIPGPVGTKSSFVVMISRNTANNLTYAVSDNGGGTWVELFNAFGTSPGNLREVQINVCVNAPPSATTITVNQSGGTPQSISYVLIECDALHPTLYDGPQASVVDQAASGTHQSAPAPGISNPNNILTAIVSAGVQTYNTTTLPAGYTKVTTGVSASCVFAYKLDPSGIVDQMGTIVQSAGSQLAVSAIQSLNFNNPAGLLTTIRMHHAPMVLTPQVPTIINDTGSTPTTLNPAAIALVITPQAPTIAFSVSLSLPTIGTALTLRSPLVQAGRILSTLEIQLFLTLRAPTLVQGITLQLPVIPLEFEPQAASLQAIQQISLPRIPLTLTLRAPTIISDKVIALPSIMGSYQIKFPLIIVEQMLTLPALPLTLQPQASHIVVTVEVLLLPAIPLHLNLLGLGKVDTGVEPPQFIGMHPVALSLPMFVNTELGEGPTTTRMTNLSLHLPMLSGARMN